MFYGILGRCLSNVLFLTLSLVRDDVAGGYCFHPRVAAGAGARFYGLTSAELSGQRYVVNSRSGLLSQVFVADFLSQVVTAAMASSG
jgi:hypothetical protein